MGGWLVLACFGFAAAGVPTARGMPLPAPPLRAAVVPGTTPLPRPIQRGVGDLDSLTVGLPHAPGAAALRVVHSPRDAGFARRLARSAAEFDPRVFGPEGPDALPSATADTVRLLVAGDEPTFREAAGGRIPDWGLAVAFPGRRAIVMRPPRLAGGDAQDPGRVLAHELVHVYLALFLGAREPSAPRWLHEGLASLLAGEWGFAERFELAFALVGGRPAGLQALEDGFPAGRDAAALAYLESLTAVAFLRDLSGERGLAVLLGNLRRSGDFDTALRRTYGITYGELETRWSERLVRRYGWAMLAESSWTIWAPAALALVLAVVLRRLRYRSRLAELKREERAGETARAEEPPPWEPPESSGEEWKGGEDVEGPAWDPRRGPPP